MTASELFVEGRSSWTLRASDGGVTGWRAERDCGLGWTERTRAEVRYRWEAIPHAPAGLPGESAGPAEWACDCGIHRTADEGLAMAVVGLCGRARAEGARGATASLSGETRRRHVLAADRAATNERAHVRVWLWITGAAATATLARVYPGRAKFLADVPHLERAVAEAARDLGRPRAECADGILPVVLAAGAPALFFHEVYGHALEGDVVAGGGSYLGPLRGRAIAHELLTVVDDPLHPDAPAGLPVDDEGRPSRSVALIDRGVVGEPLLHEASARQLGLPTNGHARRFNFRFGTLPRLTHVEVAGQAGAAADLVAPIARGVLVRSLRLRHLNTVTGAFSCYLDDAREIRAGEVGPALTPGLLVGDGLSAAAAVDAVAAGPGDEPCGITGCGKLDQGPLVVSFQQPAVRLSAAEVRPWR